MRCGAQRVAVRERGSQPCFHDVLHERGRRKERAAVASLEGIHHAFEHAPQHVGGDAAALVRLEREVEALEEPVERVSPQIVRNVAVEATLERVWLEQASVQEGDGSQRQGPSTALRRRPIAAFRDWLLAEVELFNREAELPPRASDEPNPVPARA